MIYIYNIYDITYILYISTHLICIQNPRFTLILILTRHAFLFFFFFFRRCFLWHIKLTTNGHIKKPLHSIGVSTRPSMFPVISLCVFFHFSNDKNLEPPLFQQKYTSILRWQLVLDWKTGLKTSSMQNRETVLLWINPVTFISNKNYIWMDDSWLSVWLGVPWQLDFCDFIIWMPPWASSHKNLEGNRSK